MPDTDRRTVRRPARPRKTTTRESETTMRELFAFIKAAADLGLYKLKVRIDDLFTRAEDLDPFDMHDAIERECGDPGVPMVEVELFLDRVAAVTSTINVHPSMVEAYMRGVLGIELLPWQRDLLGVYYGAQVPPVAHVRPPLGDPDRLRDVPESGAL